MKQRLYIAAIAAVVAGAAMFFAGRGCTDPQTIERIVTHTVTLPAETLLVPGRPVVIRVKPHTATGLPDSSAVSDTAATAALVARIAELQDELAQYAWLTATLDTGLVRTARVTLDGRDVEISVRDNQHVEYDFPPANRWRLMPESLVLVIPDTLRMASASSRPWYVDVLIAAGGAAASIITAILAK